MEAADRELPKGRTATYEVKRGDSLSKILVHRYKVPDQLVYNEALSRLLRLNPHITNPDLILPGQRLIIPLYDVAEAEEESGPPQAEELPPTPTSTTAWTAPETAEETKEKEAEASPEPESQPEPAEVVVDVRMPEHTVAGAPVEEEGPDTLMKTRMAPASSPEKQRVEVLADALMTLVTALGGRVQNSGRHFLPLRGEGQVTLKAESFPLLEFPTGENIFLDINDRLPDSLEEAIRANWQGRYGVVNVRDSDNFRTAWQRLLENLRSMEQWLSREPLHLHEPVEISIRGDWVLTNAKPETKPYKVFVINLLKDSEELTDPALQAYLNSLGVRVVDVHLKGQLERARMIAPLEGDRFVPKPAPLSLRPKTAQEAVAALLDLLGQSYSRDSSVPLYADGQREVTITVRAGLFFKRNGESHLIDFKVLSPPILRLLEERNVKVVVIDPRAPVTQIYRDILHHLGLTSENPYGFLVSSRDPGRNIELSLAGDLVRDAGKTYLITPSTVPPPLADYLARKDVRVLSYTNPN
jgi:hypothetical protein